MSGEASQLRWDLFAGALTVAGASIIVWSLWSLFPADASLTRAVILIGGVLTAWGGSVALRDFIRGDSL